VEFSRNHIRAVASGFRVFRDEVLGTDRYESAGTDDPVV